MIIGEELGKFKEGEARGWMGGGSGSVIGGQEWKKWRSVEGGWVEAEAMVW